jgi:predicted O-methyltransferase YrrM
MEPKRRLRLAAALPLRRKKRVDKTHLLAKRIRDRYRPMFKRDGVQLMRFGRWKSLYGLVVLVRKYLRGMEGFEIGSFSGESSLIMIDAGVSKLVCIDLWSGSKKHDMGMIRKRFLEVEKMAGGRIVSIQGDGVQVMQQLATAGRGFDFGYIDGNHEKDAVLADIEAALTLIRPGGYICGHDFGRHNLWRGVSDAVRERFGEPMERTVDSSWIVRLP